MKKKYRFNPNSLNYEEYNFLDKIKQFNFIPQIFLSIFIILITRKKTYRSFSMFSIDSIDKKLDKAN